MNINVTELGEWLMTILFVLNVIFACVVAKMVAKRHVPHVIRSTIIGTLLSLLPAFNLIHLYLMLKKPVVEGNEGNENT